METPSTTLFVADIPFNLQEPDFNAIFQRMQGFKGARLRKDRNDSTVGFADFEDITSATDAKDHLDGYKWSVLDKGLTIHFSTPTRKPRRAPEVPKENGFGVSPINPSQTFMSPTLYVSSTPTPMGPHSSQPYQNVFPVLPTGASATLYVEGLPSDSTEREVAHIFRPFPGYQSLRILAKESKQQPSRIYHLCFVEFDNKYQATFALNHLQGYRMEKDDVKGLAISYAKTERKSRRVIEPLQRRDE